MQQTFAEEAILTIVLSTVLLFSSGIAVVYYFFHQQKKRFQHQQEVLALQEAFNQIILKSKLEIQEVTLDHISKELHANFSHLASLINIYLSAALAESHGKEKSHIIDAKKLTKQLMSDIKALSVSLNSDHIMKTGFSKALELELHRLEKTGKYQVSFISSGEFFRLPAEKEIVLVRLCQEILNNIVCHAKATTITVTVDFVYNAVQIIIMDNGVGFDIETAKEKSVEKSSTGLMNIAGRAKFVQADLKIESTIGQGTKIEIAIPSTQKE